MTIRGCSSLATVALFALACQRMPGPLPEPETARPLTQPTRLCTRPNASDCRTPAEVMAILQSRSLRIVGDSDPPTGIQDTRVLTLAATDEQGREVVLRAKWRRHIPHNNYSNPRRELAVYYVQRLFLEPHEYVVPPTTGHCFELEHYRAMVDPEAAPSFADSSCVFGYLNYWVEGMQAVFEADRAGWFDADDGALDEDLFEDNAVYRKRMADINVLGVVVRHRDSHWKQFVISENPDHPVVYLVDNSMVFNGTGNTDIPDHDYSKPVVPAFSQATLGRLDQALDRVDDLAVVETFELVDGRLVHVEPRAATGELGNDGIRWDGHHLFVGLSNVERGIVAGRMRALISRRQNGQLALF